MVQETQSGDRVEHRASELEQIINTSEIWFDHLILPKMEKAIDAKFQLYMIPLKSQYKGLNKRLLVKTIAIVLIIGIMILFHST